MITYPELMLWMMIAVFFTVVTVTPWLLTLFVSRRGRKH